MIYKHIKMSVLNNNTLSNSDTDNIMSNMPELEYNIFYSNITWEITDIKNGARIDCHFLCLKRNSKPGPDNSSFDKTTPAPSFEIWSSYPTPSPYAKKVEALETKTP